MIDKYQIFLERKMINEGILLGYKTPFDSNNPIIVIEKNGEHLFLDSVLVNEYKKDFEFKTDHGIWREKPESSKYVNLNDSDIKLKEDIRYRFLGVTFIPKFNINSNRYYTTIQPINNNEGGTDKYPSWVIYADSMEDLEKKVRVKIKLYKKHYNLD